MSLLQSCRRKVDASTNIIFGLGIRINTQLSISMAGFLEKIFAKLFLKLSPKFMHYFVYILRTSFNTLYIGQTNNLERRLKEHQEKTAKSAKYIRHFSSCELVYSEVYPTRSEAMKRERQLKKLTKIEKEKLIEIRIT